MNAAAEIEGSDDLSRTVWRLAWPAVITMMLQLLNGLVDMFFVGRLGPAAQAAVGMGGQVLMLLMGVSMAVTTGATAIVARYVGAGDARTVAEASRQSLLLTAAFGAVLAVPLWLLREPVLVAMGAAPEVVRAGDVYLQAIALTTLPWFILLTLTALFQALGDLRTPLYVMLIVNGANILGDSVLINGWGPVPALGLLGAGIASGASRTAGAVVAALWLARTGLWSQAAGPWSPDSKWFGRILRIGYPAAAQSLLRSLGATGYTKILAVGPEGTAAVAALFIGLRAEGLGYMPGVAYGRAATTLVGQSLGAKRPDRAERFGWLCTWQSLAFITALSIVFFVFAEPIARLFSSDPLVIALSASYLRINALGEPFLAFAIVLGGALQGAGDTRFNAFVSVLTMWVLRLPLTWWLCRSLGLGPAAAWWTMAGTTVVQGLLLAWWFHRGRWKTIEV